MARFIRFPWATTGDRTPVPFDTDPGGAVTYAQGFGPDYEIAPGDPGWKPVPRPETNAYLYDITDNIRQYQFNGVPDWYPATDNNGIAISYPVNAMVRRSNTVWRSIIANNTVEPGTDLTAWVPDDPFSLSTLEASNAEVAAGVLGTKVITPRRLAAGVQRAPWTYSAAGGTVDAITATLAPAPAALFTGMSIFVKLTGANTVAATLNVNGLGAQPIVRIDGGATAAGDLGAGIRQFVYDSTVPAWIMVSSVAPASAADMLAGTAGYKFVTPSLLKDGFRFFDALLTAGTSVPNNTTVTPAIDTPTANTFSNSTIGPGSKITCGSLDAGVWNITGWCQYTGSGPNKSIRIHRNGAPNYLPVTRLAAQQNGAGEANDTYSISTTVRVVAGDVISFDLLHSMGVTGSVTQGRFTVTRIGS